MENNKNKKSVKFQGDMLNFCDFIQVFVFTRNHHLKGKFRDKSVDAGQSIPCLQNAPSTCMPVEDYILS